MGPQLLNIHRLMPEAILSLFGIIVMIADPFVGAARKKALGWIAYIGTLLALASVHLMHITQGLAYSGLISDDFFSIFVHVVVITAAAACHSGVAELSRNRKYSAWRILRAGFIRHRRHGNSGGRE